MGDSIIHSERRFQEAFEGQDFFLLLEADRHISMASQRLRVLRYINPVNSAAIAKRYVERENPPKEAPQYEYKELDFDPEVFKVELLNLPIINSELGRIYRAKRDEVFNILAMLEARGSPEFCDWSRLLYGTADKRTLEIANEWLRLEAEPPEEHTIDAKEAKNRLTAIVRKQRFLCEIRVRSYLSSDAAAGEVAVALRRGAYYSDNDIKSLAVHEIQTHVLRTRNGEMQPFRALFFHGFPRLEDAASGYLATEEGLATFNEELAGVLTSRRRRILAGRVKAVYLMDKEEMSFYDIFNTLVNDDKFTKEEAYTICERVFRGGGYTKDHLYLSGYEQVKKLWSESPEGFELLYMGKVGVAHLPIVKRLFKNGNGILYPARHLPVFFQELDAARRLRMPQEKPEEDEHDD
ncbi:MAG: DUF1704 domain-containing protein [Planctomycetaceae bacterium]|nr:hypothetical protein [Planctomycetota bacterium]MCQ3950687.1 hypothetical protein [Planctomycetota bacterium]NUO14902.1 DUF1704 domain-containing protein [Planctomycetaceae bacterium]GIK52392.1 MAG: hypothetical protein BroJett014_13650 [Planctomycetota bacterium]HRJ78240.1 DUF1704 domain-containing protein [Planctomycetota bacterium]